MNKKYESEVKERWGTTEAYREYTEKTKNYTKEKWAEANEMLMLLFSQFADAKDRGTSATALEVLILVARLQDHITQNYYTCTDEILAGLGKMYVAEERFRKNIDRFSSGTAEYVSAAIEEYCKGR